MIYHQQRYAQELEARVLDGCRWLDIGAGARIHGWGAQNQAALAKRAAELVGCDTVGEHLAKNPYLTRYDVCRAETMPYADQSFDLVTANMVCEHMDDPTAIFRQVRRVLVPGGVFVAMTPRRFHPIVLAASIVLPRPVRSLFAGMKERWRPAEHIFQTYYRCNSVGAITRHANAAGLAVVTIEAFQSFPFARGWLGKVEASFGWRSNLLVVLQRSNNES